jgi:hypothetical protein
VCVCGRETGLYKNMLHHFRKVMHILLCNNYLWFKLQRKRKFHQYSIWHLILIVNRKMYTFILKFGLDLFTFINSFGFCLHFNRPSWWFSSSELQCNCSSEWFSILQRKQITFNADVTMHCIAYCTGSTKHKTFFLCQGSLHLI